MSETDHLNPNGWILRFSRDWHCTSLKKTAVKAFLMRTMCKLLCFDRNINGNRDGKFLECDYLLVQRCVKLTLIKAPELVL